MNIYTLEVFIISGPVDAKFVKKNPVLSRTIIIRGDQTLAQLHKIIFKAFDRFDEHLYEFQVGGKSPQYWSYPVSVDTWRLAGCGVRA
jgi:hypothetical protein